MITAEPLTPQAEKTALDDLLKSDGWAIVRQLVEQRYGAVAQLRDIDAAMTELKPGDDELAVVTQIRAAGKAAFSVLDLAEARLRQVSSGKKTDEQTLFASFRRGPKTR